MSFPTWNDKLSLTDGSYFVSDIQDYFEYMTKTHETVTENRIIFKIKTIWNFWCVKRWNYIEALKAKWLI